MSATLNYFGRYKCAMEKYYSYVFSLRKFILLLYVFVSNFWNYKQIQKETDLSSDDESSDSEDAPGSSSHYLANDTISKYHTFFRFVWIQGKFVPFQKQKGKVYFQIYFPDFLWDWVQISKVKKCHKLCLWVRRRR